MNDRAINPRIGEKQVSYQRCEWNLDGEHCRYPGTIALTVYSGNGPHPGPWYCSLHARCDDMVQGADIMKASRDYRPPSQVHGKRDPLVDAMAAQSLRELNASVPAEIRALGYAQCIQHIREGKRRIGRNEASPDWARRIVDRVDAGDTSMGLHAETLARAVLAQESTDVE